MDINRSLPPTIYWGNQKWVKYPQMNLIWEGNAGQLPIELLFGNYLLRSPHSMLWIHLADEQRGEPFDIWEIRIQKLENNTPDFNENEEEILEEDDWENVIVENGCDIKTMANFLKRCIFEDKMTIYIQPRKPWDPKVANQYELNAPV
jgi:hypothetical protein